MQKVVFVISVVLCTAYAAQLPSELTRCKPNDAACLTASAKKFMELFKQGDPKLGLVPIEPLYVKKIFVPGNGGQVDLIQEFDDVNVHGFTNSAVSNFAIDLEKCHLHFEIACQQPVEMIGTHHLRGKLLIFQLKGHGRSNITLIDLVTKHDIDCSKETKNGKTYLKIDKYTIKMHPKRLLFDFENLIENNEQLSNEVLRVANESSDEIYGEIRDDYDKTFSEVFKQYVQQLFKRVPVESLFV